VFQPRVCSEQHTDLRCLCAVFCSSSAFYLRDSLPRRAHCSAARDASCGPKVISALGTVLPDACGNARMLESNNSRARARPEVCRGGVAEVKLPLLLPVSCGEVEDPLYRLADSLPLGE
jgi:hypothetical protein